jgi:hypothetical protein
MDCFGLSDSSRNLRKLPFLGRGNLISDRWADGVMITVRCILQRCSCLLSIFHNRMTRIHYYHISYRERQSYKELPYVLRITIIGVWPNFHYLLLEFGVTGYSDTAYCKISGAKFAFSKFKFTPLQNYYRSFTIDNNLNVN